MNWDTALLIIACLFVAGCFVYIAYVAAVTGA